MRRFLILNGPNLNLLGRRQPDVYGGMDFETYLDGLRRSNVDLQIDYFQNNAEGELIDQLHRAEGVYEGVILNAGAYTHTSIAIADAIQAISTPVVEVHISNIYAREAFRHTSYTAPYCKGLITGFGLKGYELALKSFLLEG